MNTHDKINGLIEKIKEVPAMDFAGRAKGLHDLLAAIKLYQQRIEELESQLEAVGAGGVSSQRITSSSRGELVARVNDDGFIVETGLGLAPGTLLYTAPQPAEPVKVPSDADILDLWTGDPTHSRPVMGKNKVIAFARALLARYGQNPTIPAGWQLVPKDPTEEMLAATSWPNCAGTDYKHMLAAAPEPPCAL